MADFRRGGVRVKYTPRGECCTVEGCGSHVHAKNLCNLHYRAARRPLTFDDVVHHKNGNKKDNRPENLQVMTRAAHVAEHKDQMQGARRAAKSKTT